MLNFKANFNIDVKETHYPITFDRKNICIHCGAEGALKFVDKFGNETVKEIHALDYIKCTNCGRTYSMMWKNDPDKDRMYPVAVDRTVKREFLNLLSHPTIKNYGDKKLD